MHDRGLALCAAMLLLSGCSTTKQALELRRDQLLRIEKGALAARDLAVAGAYDREKYDAYLAIRPTLFDNILKEVSGSKFDVVANGRTIAVEVQTVRMAFRPGSPEISLVASVIDKRSGLSAAIDIDTRLILEGDPNHPDQMFARVTATRIVPKLAWGPLEFTKARFVRSLLALEATKFTERLPRFSVPVKSAFAFGEAAQDRATGRISTGGDSWIKGTVAIPSTLISGRFVVKHVVFLESGVHLFANVEGI
jgi:hypothetical protein